MTESGGAPQPPPEASEAPAREADDSVCYEERGPVAVVTLNRPRYRNAQNSAMTYALDAAFARAVNSPQVAVIGVPDTRLGEVGRAYVVTRPGRALDAPAVLGFCRERLAGYKVPREVVFRDDLPRTPAGKPLKRLLREEAFN